MTKVASYVLCLKCGEVYRSFSEVGFHRACFCVIRIVRHLSFSCHLFVKIELNPVGETLTQAVITNNEKKCRLAWYAKIFGLMSL